VKNNGRKKITWLERQLLASNSHPGHYEIAFFEMGREEKEGINAIAMDLCSKVKNLGPIGAIELIGKLGVIIAGVEAEELRLMIRKDDLGVKGGAQR